MENSKGLFLEVVNWRRSQKKKCKKRHKVGLLVSCTSFLPFLFLFAHSLLFPFSADILHSPNADSYSIVACLRFKSSSVRPNRCISSTTKLSRKTIQLFSKMLPRGVKGSRSPIIYLAK